MTLTQDVALLFAFGVAGVGAKENGVGHFHIHFAALPLSFQQCGALIKAGGAAIAPKWPWSAFETHWHQCRAEKDMLFILLNSL